MRGNSLMHSTRWKGGSEKLMACYKNGVKDFCLRPTCCEHYNTGQIKSYKLHVHETDTQVLGSHLILKKSYSLFHSYINYRRNLAWYFYWYLFMSLIT